MADPANTALGKMLSEEITPVVMVLSTPLVEEACAKNGLSFVEMLAPFSSFNNIDVPVRTSSDQLYRLQKFKLRLFYAADIRQRDLEVAKERLKQVITQAGEIDFEKLSSDPPQINDLIASQKSEMLPTWFQYYNKELVQTVSFSDHEAYDHPVACLLVVSSKDEEPINRFVDLFNSSKLPSLLDDGAMDPKILKHYLLVHDNQDGSSERATKLLTEMKSTFGSNECHLLYVNSSEDGTREHRDNPWALYKHEASSINHLGCALSDDDIIELKNFVQDFSSKDIIPYMEQKIRALNEQVSATRKGFRNQIKNLWWRKGKEEESTRGPTYTFSSVESQIRVLGDYAFMLHDYELALSSYRLISTDYKLDKAWRRYAGVQEMMGLAYFISDQSRKEAEYCMENAFTTYSKLGTAGVQNATRCGLWWVEMLKARDQYKEAATVYVRICGEESLHAAVMLEQASYCYLLSKPPMLHKYGFHLVLSGDRYKNCSQVKHAIRTYINAISVYKWTTWSYIKDHVYFHIGQWYALVGMYDVAVKNMLEVLACAYQSKTTQELYLRDFLQIVQKTGKKQEVLQLQLPVINTSSLQVIFEDQRTYASSAAATVKESVWQTLEEEIIPSMTNPKANWLELQSKLMPKKYRESNVCVAGEAVKLEIEFKNPLQISISISSVSLICELAKNSDDTSDLTSSGSATELQNPLEHDGGTSSGVSSFILSEAEFCLAGGETKLVQLTVTPREEGILKVLGVRWELSGSVVGVHHFHSNVVKAKTSRGRRKVKQSPASDLKFLVIKSLPRLEGKVLSFPEKAYAGDLRYLVLELENQSEFPVENLKMKISLPRFLRVGNQEELTKEFPECIEKRKGDKQSSEPHKTNNGLFIFPEDISIQSGTSLQWPLWLRAAVPGKMSFYISVYYEMGNVSTTMRYRTLRMHYNLQVLPSLETSFQITPSPSKLHEFLLRMEVVNRTRSECFHLHQLSSVGPRWEVSSLHSVDTVLPSGSLSAGQALSWFFMLKDTNPSSSLPQTDVRLAPLDKHEALYDISKSPLVDFHDFERSNLEIPHQGDPSTVDFILISRAGNTSVESGESGPPQLLSHHACHCSITSPSPISWTLEGPRSIHHDFASPFCEIKLKMTINNSSDAIASVEISTVDPSSSNSKPSDTSSSQTPSSSDNQSGWRYLPATSDTKSTSDVVETTHLGKQLTSIESITPFIWSGLISTKVQIQPLSTAEIPLQVSVFSPGIYDLSNYKLNWELKPAGEQKSIAGFKQLSGTCRGYPYHLTVLQQQ